MSPEKRLLARYSASPCGPVVPDVDRALAVVPALLGEIPAHEIVVVLLHSGRVIAVARIALGADPQRVADMVSRLAADEVFIVVVGGVAAAADLIRLADDLCDHLRLHSIRILSYVHAPTLGTAAVWTALDGTSRSGRVPDITFTWSKRWCRDRDPDGVGR